MTLSPLLQALVHKFHLEDMSAFDLIFSFGLPPGQILREPLTASYLVLVEDTLAYYVTQVCKMHGTAQHP